MITNKIEHLVPGLAEMRAREQLNRAIAFASVAGFTHTLCGVEVRPFAPIHRLGLELMGNAFMLAHVEPLGGDVFQFLWFLSPGWVPHGSGRRIRSELRQWRLRRHVRRLNLDAAKGEIHAFLDSQMQDSAESAIDSGADQRPWVHWSAASAGFWIDVHGGFTLESYFQTPYLVLQQLYRAWKCNNPRIERDANGDVRIEDPQFINESDRLIGRWRRQFAKDAAEIIRNQRYRKN